MARDEKLVELEEDLERLRQAVRMARQLLDRFADPFSEVWDRKRGLAYSLAANVVLELDVALGNTPRAPQDDEQGDVIAEAAAPQT